MHDAKEHLATQRLWHVLLTLVFASALCAGMVVVREAYVGDLRFRFSWLCWNLFLAWIPLGLALLVRRIGWNGDRLWLASAMIAWLLFFPNAFYITTDLVHIKKFGSDGVYLWFDILMTACFACGGMFLGSLSLYLLHLFIRQRFGRGVGWLFAGTMLALGSFGVYLGRFLRLNSWDVVTRPLRLAGDIAASGHPKHLPEVTAFSATFFLFSLAVYGFVVAMARFHGEPAPAAMLQPAK